MDDVVLSVSDFVAITNQTFQYALPSVTVAGELANLRVSKNRWVYFDLKDDSSSVKFFGTVHQLPGPLEDGLMMRVQATPKLHQLYGFSLNVLSMQPMGEGSLRRAADLLQAKLAAEGLFDIDRKRPLPYPPQSIGLITSAQSAAYHDFTKILDNRWSGIEIQLADVQVQGEPAVQQIVNAISYFNSHDTGVELLVITRGGGSADDLAAFSSELVVRAIAASRLPTLVAIGHEIDTSLGELAADVRASTPSNAAEIMVPDRRTIKLELVAAKLQLGLVINQRVELLADRLQQDNLALHTAIDKLLAAISQSIQAKAALLQALSPTSALQRGYAMIRQSSKTIMRAAQLTEGQTVRIILHDGQADATISRIKLQ